MSEVATLSQRIQVVRNTIRIDILLSCQQIFPLHPMPTWQSGVKRDSLSHLGEDEDEERGRKGGDKEAKEEAEGTLNRKLTKKEEGHFSTAGRVADPKSVAFDTIDSPKGPTTT